MKRIYWIHICGFEIVLNALAFYFTDGFFYNQTYIGNTLGHVVYLWLWTLSSVFGFYQYSKIIFENLHFTYHKKIHFLLCFGMIFSLCFPYRDDIFLWSNEFHVWIAGFCILGFLLEWIKIASKYSILYPKQFFIFFSIVILSIGIMLLFDHITSFCEVFFTFSMNVFLFLWAKKSRESSLLF
ncbi:hypothetical protein [Floccifex sp.]|uniref:hypothetical protein n=1 Tax=Floccifex sp. TaxID=2815810 RepID=UPI003F057BE2